MRDEKEERKKQARSNKQTRQSNTAHPRQSLFLRKTSCLGWVKLGQYLAMDLVGFFKELYMEIQLWIRYSRREGGKGCELVSLAIPELQTYP